MMQGGITEKIIQRKDYFRKNILKWSEKNSPEYPWRNNPDPYQIMVSEMLLRRTRASSVIRIYEIFLKKFPDVKTLAKSSESDIERIIGSLGMKFRARNIKSVASNLVQNYSGKIPDSEVEILKIIGKESYYATNAILCFGMNQKVPIFDVNVKRIFERMFSIDFGKAPHKKKQSWRIVADALPDKNIKQYNWALLDFGKAVCTPSNPKCPKCPLKSICDYASKGS